MLVVAQAKKRKKTHTHTHFNALCIQTEMPGATKTRDNNKMRLEHTFRSVSNVKGLISHWRMTSNMIKKRYTIQFVAHIFPLNDGNHFSLPHIHLSTRHTMIALERCIAPTPERGPADYLRLMCCFCDIMMYSVTFICMWNYRVYLSNVRERGPKLLGVSVNNETMMMMA